MNTWQKQNLTKIKQNLGWLHAKDDGVLLRQGNDKHSVAVIKQSDELALYFVTETDDPKKPFVSGAMSRLNISHPLHLQGIYARAMMLSLAFVPEPEHLYMMGFGGGIQSMAFHHYFPQLVIHGSETDTNVLEVAEMCFGLTRDHRIQIAQKDGRTHINENQQIKYDIILLDCFSEAGEQPMSLATVEFYKLCQTRLTDDGVVALNIIEGSPKFKERRDTFLHAFNHSYDFKKDDTHILYGSNSCMISAEEILKRAITLETKHNFEFSLSEIAQKTTVVDVHNTPSLLFD